MRSTNYSAKGNFSAAFKATARRRLPGMIIITVICGLVSAVGAFVQLSDYMYYGDTLYLEDIVYSAQLWAAAITLILAVYLFVITCDMFAPYFKRRQCDYHLALPVTRADIYNSNFLFGLLSIIPAAAASCVLYMGTLRAGLAALNRTVVSDSEQSCVFQFLCMPAALLAAYAAFHMSAAVAGEKTQYFLYCLVCLESAPVLFMGFAEQLNIIWGLYADAMKAAVFTPAGAFIDIFSDSEVRDSHFCWVMIIMLAEAAAMYAAGLLEFKRRKAETAESGMEPCAVKYIFMAVFTGAGYMYLATMRSVALSMLLGVLGVFICAAIFAPLNFHRKKLFNKKTGALFGAVAAFCLAFTGCACIVNASGYVRYTPAVADVQSVTVKNYDSWSDYSMDTALFGLLDSAVADRRTVMNEATLSQPENIESVIAFHIAAVSDEARRYSFSDYVGDVIYDAIGESETEEYDPFAYETINCRIEYTLKDGSTVTRTYSIQYDLWNKYIPIFRNEEALLQQEPYSYTDEEEIMFLYVNGYSETEDEYAYEDVYIEEYYVLPPEMWQQIRDAAVQDKLEENDSDFYMGYDSLSYISVYTINPQLPQAEQEKIRAMTPYERNQYDDAYWSSVDATGPEPFLSADITLNPGNERLLSILSSEDCEQYKYEVVY